MSLLLALEQVDLGQRSELGTSELGISRLGVARLPVFHPVGESGVRPDMVRFLLVGALVIELSLFGRVKIESSFLGKGVRRVEVGDLVG